MIKTSANTKFTTPQKHSLDSSRNLGVRANAGSGKTSVLVDRIIQILEQNRPADDNEFTPDPMPAFSIENIVSITFTKKAAGELKARLMKLLQELELQSVGHVKKWWAKQIEKLEDAPIGTIDSFFGSILREYALMDDSEDRIEPDFELMDPYDAQEMQGIAVRSVLESRDEIHPKLAEALVWWKNLDGADVLEENLKKLLGNSAGVKAVLRRNPQVDPDTEAIAKVNTDSAFVKLHKEKNELLQMLNALLKRAGQERKKTVTLEGLISNSLEAQQMLEEDVVGREVDILEFLEEMLLTSGQPRKFKGCDPVRDEINALLESWAGPLAAKRVDFALEKKASLARNHLMLILAEVDQKYRALCLQKNTYDFDTVARGVLRIFERSPTIILDLKKRYRFIQVDEFQDTSRLQWEILSYLVGGGPDPEQPLDNDRLFIVGDPQQSIYGFRQADVAVFSEVIQKITKGNKTNQLHQVQTLHERHSTEIASPEVRAGDVKLSENFRTLAISPLGLFNHLFNYVFDPITHSIDSSKSYEVKFQELIPGLDNESKGEVVYIDYQVNATDEESDGISMGQVRMIVEELIRFKGAPRSKLGEDNLPKVFSWKDMAILVPSRNDTLRKLEEHLRTLGIPYLLHGGVGFWQRQEVLDMMQLCQSLSQPGNDLALLGVLRGPCLRCNDADLYFYHCLGGGRMPRGLSILVSKDANLERACNGKLHHLKPEDRQNLEEAWIGFSDEDRTRLVRASKSIGLVGEWRLLVDRVSHADLLQHCMEQTGAYAIYASLPDGEQVLANLQKFFEFLRNEESKPGSSLAKVAHALEERVEASNRDSQANPGGHGIDAVQIMTIHASKGLQFPLVVVANMQRMIVRNKTENIIASSEGEVGLKIRHPANPRKILPDSKFELIKKDIDSRELAESRRLFYVGTTRAEEVLVLAGHKPFRDCLSWRRWIYKALDLQISDFEKGYWEKGNLRVRCRSKSDGGQLENENTGMEEEAIEDLRRFSETPKMVTLSVTRIEDELKMFEEKPAEWKLRNTHHVLSFYSLPRFDTKPEDDIRKYIGALIGNTVHRSLERHGEWLNSKKDEQLAWIHKMVDAEIGLALAELGEEQALVLGVDEIQKIKAQAVKLLETAKGSEIKPLVIAEGKVEIEFLLPIEGYVIQGRIDKLLNQGGVVEIIDWKTDAGPTKKSIEHHQFQMKLYALALLNCNLIPKDQDVVRARLVLLDHDVLHTYEFKQAELRKFEKELAGKMLQMKRKLSEVVDQHELQLLYHAIADER